MGSMDILIDDVIRLVSGNLADPRDYLSLRSTSKRYFSLLDNLKSHVTTFQSLPWAIINNRLDLLRLKLRYQKDAVSSTNSFVLAAVDGKLDMVKWLWDARPEVRTALHVALYHTLMYGLKKMWTGDYTEVATFLASQFKFNRRYVYNYRHIKYGEYDINHRQMIIFEMNERYIHNHMTCNIFFSERRIADVLRQQLKEYHKGNK